MGFSGQRIVAIIAGSGAAGTGDARRVRFVGHHFRATGFTCDTAATSNCTPPMSRFSRRRPSLVHPEVVVNPLLRALMEVAAGPDIGVGGWTPARW